MRLNENGTVSAYEIVNTYPEKRLADLIFLYGEEKLSRKIASAIVNERAGGEISSSKALADIIYDCVPEKYRHGPIHPATRTFQAIRIAVNDELGHLPKALFDAFNCLKPGGKMGVITFHSLEDRIVKNFFRNLGKECVCPQEYPTCKCGGTPCAEIITRKPVGPTEDEVKINSPSRSAKLRVVRKIKDAGQQYHPCRVSFPNASEIQVAPNADHLKQRRARSGRAPVAKPETGRAGNQRPEFPGIIGIDGAYSGEMHGKRKENISK